MVVVSDGMLREFVTEILKAAGTPAEEAAWVADCLVLSNVKGVDSHGVQQVPGYVRSIQDGHLKPGAELTLLKETTATALFDGGGGFGYTMAREAMKITIEKAKEAGIAYSGIRNLHHIGRVGRWAEMALEEGMIGIASQPGGVYVAPWGGIDRKLPIAPIAVAVPARKHKPIVIDMSLGPIAGGRNSILALRGMRLPQGWMVDGDGNPSDDPAMFQRGEGAQLPLGQAGLGYKGMALNLIIDILSGPLIGFLSTTGSPFQRRGVFLGTIDVEAFIPLGEFEDGVDAIIEDLKSSRLADGFSEITVPGEPEWREEEMRLREGIYLDDKIYGRILDTAEKVGIDTTKYKGKPGRLEITHPSYTLKDRYK